MSNRLFGTDGVRGVANAEPITSETALKLRWAMRFRSGRLARIGL
jgi:phosphomannomutase